MIEDVRKNKMKTGIIVSLFVLGVTLLLYYICIAFDLGPASIVIALGASIISAWASYYFSDKIILTLNGARPATEEEDRKLVNILDSLVISAGLEAKPKLYVMESNQANAFATGRNPKNSVICVTTGLLEKMEYYELEGVVAHELAHIKNYDILLSAVVTVMVGLVVMLADLFTRSFVFRGSSRDSDNKAGGILMLVGLIFLIVSPIFAKLMQLAVSRRREYLADATAIQFTRNPEGLIRALEKLQSDTDILERSNTATESMFIVTPLKSQKKKKTNWFSTHPPIENRIEALKNIR